MDLEKYLYDKVLPVIKGLKDKNIYAISFLVNSNESNIYKGFSNFPVFLIGYNTEKDCNHASSLSEERWNFAFWRREMIEIIKADDFDDGAKFLFNWYEKNGIKNIGFEDCSSDYDDEMNYIGKGPIGYYELLTAVSNVARKLQLDGKIKSLFGEIPIIVHDYEYSWYVEDATKNANPNGEANTFLDALEKGFSQ